MIKDDDYYFDERFYSLSRSHGLNFEFKKKIERKKFSRMEKILHDVGD